MPCFFQPKIKPHLNDEMITSFFSNSLEIVYKNRRFINFFTIRLPTNDYGPKDAIIPCIIIQLEEFMHKKN